MRCYPAMPEAAVFWSTRSDLNRRTRDLQSPPLGHSGTCALFGSGVGTRIPTNGFGDRHAAITSHRNNLAHRRGFDPLTSAVTVQCSPD